MVFVVEGDRRSGRGFPSTPGGALLPRAQLARDVERLVDVVPCKVAGSMSGNGVGYDRCQRVRTRSGSNERRGDSREDDEGRTMRSTLCGPATVTEALEGVVTELSDEACETAERRQPRQGSDSGSALVHSLQCELTSSATRTGSSKAKAGCRRSPLLASSVSPALSRSEGIEEAHLLKSHWGARAAFA